MKHEIECTNDNCKWTGTRNERFRSVKGFMLCPKCHNKEFYQIAPYSMAVSSSQSAVAAATYGLFRTTA